MMKLGKARRGHSLFGTGETQGFKMGISCTIVGPMFYSDQSLRDCVLDMKMTSERVETFVHCL